jgi:hypothetical protein
LKEQLKIGRLGSLLGDGDNLATLTDAQIDQISDDAKTATRAVLIGVPDDVIDTLTGDEFVSVFESFGDSVTDQEAPGSTSMSMSSRASNDSTAVASMSGTT